MKINNLLIAKIYKILIIFILAIFSLQILSILPAIASEGGEAIISTGDAEVILGVENDINQNSFDATGEGDEEEIIEEEIIIQEDENTSSTPEEIDINNDLATSTDIALVTSTNEIATTSEKIIDDLIGNQSAASTSSTTIQNNNNGELDNSLVGDGNSGGNEIGENEGDSIILTGDADIIATADNNVNNNKTIIPCENECENECASSSENLIDIKNNNLSSTTNDVDLTGNTGENEIASTSGTAIISTGDINILNVIINYINQNFFGIGREFFINIFKKYFGSIDLSGYGEEDAEVLKSLENNENECEPDCVVNIQNNSTSTLMNDVLINANTGTNNISTSTGVNIIETGDISVVSDIVNMANLNITGQDWFFAVVNVFDVLSGDIILPSNGDLEDKDISSTSVASVNEFIIANTNYASTYNSVDINGNSGRNQVDGNGTSTILTGDVDASVSAFNLVNYNFTGDSWKLVRLNIFGSWDGVIHGLPDGYEYWQDESGITIYNDLFLEDIFSEGLARLNVENDNYASTTNNVEINANSGDNSILHNGTGIISTGDIDIRSSVLNFINSNFTGNDWEFSIINVFGDWQGNLAFGQPELWITESIKASEPAKSGEYVTYTFLFGNNGDGRATNVRIIDDFNEEFFNIADNGNGEENEGLVLFGLEELPPNSQGSISYTVQVKDDIANGEHKSQNEAIISSDETDRDYNNNTTGGSVIVSGGSSSSNKFNITMWSGDYFLPNLGVVKSNDASDVVRPGDLVNFKIIVKNTGSARLENVLVADVMTNELTGEEINDDYWDLGAIYDREDVILEYTIEIKSNIRSGTYINQAVVEGFDTYRGAYVTAVASSKIKVENPDMPEDGDKSAELVVGRTARSSFLNPTEIGEYRIIIANNGDGVAKEVKIFESLPQGFIFYDNNAVFKEWDLGDIQPGEIKSIGYLAVAGRDLEPGIYTSATAVKAKNIISIVKNFDTEVRKVLVLSSDYSEPAFVQYEQVTQVDRAVISAKEEIKPEDNLDKEPFGEIFGLEAKAAELYGAEAESDYENKLVKIIIGFAVVLTLILVSLLILFRNLEKKIYKKDH